MEKKKNERADLQNKRLLFTEIGCILALAVVYFGFEYTTAEVRTAALEDAGTVVEVEDMIPIKLKACRPDPFVHRVKRQ